MIGEAACNAEDILVNMEQEPSDFLQDAIFPVMKGLIAEALLKHCNEDVRVSVASCLSEILRITLPQQPFNDNQMKAIFQLIVEALSKLSQSSTRCYEKALSILETIARVKACLLMLDLGCEVLVLDMCQHFWEFTRSNPSADENWAVEQIMADIFTESDDISPDLLIPLLASVLKENEKVAPSSWKLGEKLISDCAVKLRPILRGALQSKGTTFNDYSPVVASLYQNESTTEHNDTSGCPKQDIADCHVRLRKQNGSDGSFQSTIILSYKEAGAITRLQEVKEAPNLGNQNVGGDESSDDESTEDVFEFRARSKDVQLENPSSSDDSTPEASPPRAIGVGSKNLQLENPGTSTLDDSTPEASPLRYIRVKSKDVRLQSTSNDSTPEASPPRYIKAKSKDVRLQSTSDDSTPEGSPPRPWGLGRSRRH